MYILLAVVLVVLCAAVLLLNVGHREDGLPPGPPTLPIIWNLHMLDGASPEADGSLDSRNGHRSTVACTHLFTKLKMGPRTAIVLSDAAAVKELMEKRSLTTANRLPNYVVEHTTGGLHIALTLSTSPLFRTVGRNKGVIAQRRGKRELHGGSPGEGRRTRDGQGNDGIEFLCFEFQYLGGALIEGASESTAAYIHSLVLVFTAYPDAQRKTHRFRPFAPLLVPHATTVPQEYSGYLIPEGATIFVNLCKLLKIIPALRLDYFASRVSSSCSASAQTHLPQALYDNPEDFVLDRYLLTENGAKPDVDGSDLRPNLACEPPRTHSKFYCTYNDMVSESLSRIHLAQNSIARFPSYLYAQLLTGIIIFTAMNLLWAFNFKTDIDAEGNFVKVDTFAYKKRLGLTPQPFTCQITPRTTEKAAIIKHAFSQAADTFGKFEFGLSPDDRKYVAKSRPGSYSI
ncbi:hypothetical protein FB451DRAFT_1179801 [Mycena latifolia]|nr:hypothetical protein FB451DRAFT_1179801 [Mycena latifolia]